MSDGSMQPVFDNVRLGVAPFWLFMALGDDFEFLEPRGAASLSIYLSYYKRGGYTDILTQATYTKDGDTADEEYVEAVRRAFYTYRSIVKTYKEDDTESCIKSLVKVVKRRTFAPDVSTKAWTTFVTQMDKFRMLKAAEIVPETKEAQMGETEDFPKSSPSLNPDTDEVDTWVQSIGEAAIKMPQLVGEVTTAAESINAAIAEISPSLQKMAETVTNSSENVVSTLQSMYNVGRLGIFGYHLYQMFKPGDWKEKWMHVAGCALALGLSSELVMKAGEWLLGALGTIMGSTKVHENPETQPKRAENWESEWDNDNWMWIQENLSIFKMIGAAAATLGIFYCSSSARCEEGRKFWCFRG